MKPIPMIVCTLMLALALAGCTLDTEDQDRFETRLEAVALADGLELPVGVSYDLDGVGYIVQQNGTVLQWRNETPDDNPFLNVSHLLRPSDERHWEQGLLDLQWHPVDPERFYITYTPERDPQTNSQRVVLAEYHHNRTTGENTHIADLYDVSKPMPYHNGGNIQFDADGHLFVSIGDGSPFGTNRDGSFNDPQANAQNPDTLLGSILRIKPTTPGAYDIPADNPFVGEPNAREEVWMLGMRNPFQFHLEPDGDLWVGDVGSFRREEINHIPAQSQAGANLGWPWFEGSIDITRDTKNATHPAIPDEGIDEDDYVFPVWEYDNPETGCVVTAGFRYHNGTIETLEGRFIVADYCTGQVWGLQEQNGEWTNEVLLELDDVAISAIDRTPSGELLIVDHVNGRLLEVRATQ